MTYTISIHFNNGKVKNIEGATKYKIFGASIKIYLPDYKSIIVPFTNVNFYEVESFKVEEEEVTED